MLLVLEICLMIAAWQRGWKGWALLPPVITFGGGYLLGSIMFASGASDESMLAAGLVLDFLCIGTLIGMIVKARKKSHHLESEQASETTAVDVR
jgi:ATP/ADP translocase